MWLPASTPAPRCVQGLGTGSGQSIQVPTLDAVLEIDLRKTTTTITLEGHVMQSDSGLSTAGQW